jgi:Flp pilus assembly protein TadG
VCDAVRGPWNDGVTAVELAFAMPVFVLFVVGAIQFGALFFLKGNMDDAARNAARGLALGGLTESQAVTEVKNKLTNWGGTFTVTATVADPADPNSAVVEISVPVAEVVFINYLNLFTGESLKSRVAMWSEL